MATTADRTQTLGTIFMADFTSIKEGIKSVRSEFNKYATAISQLQKSLSGITKEMDSAVASTNELNNAVSKGSKSFKDAGSGALTDYALATGKASNESAALRKSLESITAQTTREGTALKVTTKAIYAAETGLQKRALAIRENTKLGERANIIADIFTKNIGNANRQTDAAFQSIGRLNIATDGYSERTTQSAIASIKARAEQDKYAKSLDMTNTWKKNAIEVSKRQEEVEKSLGIAQKGQLETLSEYAKAQGKASNESPKYREALSKLVEVYGREGIALNESVKALNRVEAATQRRVAALKSSTKLGEEGIIAGDRLNASFDRANAVLKNQNGIMADVIKKRGQSKQAIEAEIPVVGKFSDAINRVIGSFKSLASYTIAGSIIYGFINAVKSGVGELINYDQALKNVQAVTKSTDAEISLMGDVIKQTAVDTKYSTVEIANAMVLLGQAGFSATESIQAIKGVTILATATLEDMVLVTDLVTTTIRAYNLTTVETERVTDVMANAINRSKLTVDKLRTAFNYVGAAASQVGLTLEETTAAMMVLADNGMRASTIGTGLRQVLSRLVAPNRVLREAFEAHGIALSQVNPSVVGFDQSLRNLIPTLWDSEKGVVDMGKAYSLFGLRGAQAAAIIAKAYLSGEYQNALSQLYETGSAAAMAERQLGGLALQIKNLMDRLKVLAVNLGEGGVTSGLKNLVLLLREVVGILIQITENSIGKFTLGLASTAAAVFTVTGAVALLIVGLIKLGTMFVGAIANLNPWVRALVIASTAIATIISLIDKLVVTNKEHAKAMELAALKTTQESESLSTYRDVLVSLQDKVEKGIDVRLEYASVLKRLSESHKELYKDIDFEKMAHKDIIALIEKQIGLDQVGRLKSYTEAAKANNETLKDALKITNASLSVQAEILLGMTSEEKALADIAKNSKEAKEAYAALESSLRGILAVYVERIAKGDMTIDQAKKEVLAWENTYKIEHELVEKLLTVLTNIGNVKKLQAEQEEILAAAAMSRIKKLPPEYAAVYETLDALRKTDLLKSLEDMEKQQVAFEERAELIGLTEQEIAEGRKAIQDKILVDFFKFLEKQEEKEIDSINRRYKLEEQALNTLTDKEILILEESFKKKEISERDHRNRVNQLEVDLAKKILDLRTKQLEDIEKIADVEVDKVEAAANAKLIAEKNYIKAKVALMEIPLIEDAKLRDQSLKRLEIGLKKDLFKNKEYLDKHYINKEQAETEKLRLEEEYTKKILEIRSKFFEEAKKYMEADVNAYLEALDAKQEAEEAHYEAERAVEEDRKTKSKETTKKVKEDAEEIKHSWKDVSITLSKAIEVDISTDSAEKKIKELYDTKKEAADKAYEEEKKQLDEVYEKEKELQTLRDKRLKDIDASYNKEMFLLQEVMNTELEKLSIEKFAAEEGLKLIAEDEEGYIAALTKKLNAEMEFNAATDKAELTKLEAEKESIKERLSEQNKFFETIKQEYDSNTQQYIEALDAQQEAQMVLYNSEKKFIQQEYLFREEALQTQLNKELSLLTAQLNAKKISEEEYNKEKERIERSLADQVVGIRQGATLAISSLYEQLKKDIEENANREVEVSRDVAYKELEIKQDKTNAEIELTKEGANAEIQIIQDKVKTQLDLEAAYLAAKAELQQKYINTIAGLEASYMETMASVMEPGRQLLDSFKLSLIKNALDKAKHTLSNINLLSDTGVKMFQRGGIVQDKIGIAEKGEYVIRPSVVGKLGKPFFDWINSFAGQSSIGSTSQFGQIAYAMREKGIANAEDLLKSIIGVKSNWAHAGRNLTPTVTGWAHQNKYAYNDSSSHNWNITTNGNMSAQEIASEVDAILTKNASYNRSSFYNYVRSKK